MKRKLLEGVYESNTTEDKEGDTISFQRTSKMTNMSVVYKILRKEGPIKRIVVSNNRISVTFVNELK